MQLMKKVMLEVVLSICFFFQFVNEKYQNKVVSKNCLSALEEMCGANSSSKDLLTLK